MSQAYQPENFDYTYLTSALGYYANGGNDERGFELESYPSPEEMEAIENTIRQALKGGKTVEQLPPNIRGYAMAMEAVRRTK